MNKNIEYVLKLAHDSQVKFIRLWFTDILGFLKSFAITIDELEDAIIEGVGFDGSTLHGAARTDEQEKIAMPDISTFRVLPWRPSEDSVARMFCTVLNDDRTPYEGDTRYVLKKNLEKIAASGLTFYTGPEIEFFFFKNSSKPEILDRGGYYDLTPLDIAADYRRQLVLTLEKMGIEVISSHHEASHSQHEIDLRHQDALTIADSIMSFRLIAKEIGQQNGIYASFMPKPLSTQNGSGLHIHMSLFKDNTNIFYDAAHVYRLSAAGRGFLAGILRHAEEIFPLTNQWINSYKRLIRGYESPININWSHNNPSSLARIPLVKNEKSESMRIELRSPDPACNPYLAFAGILAAGMKGIESGYELPEPDNIENRGKKIKHRPVPEQLAAALSAFKKSKLMKESLGGEIFEKFIENKEIEIDRFNKAVTDYEINNYLPLL